MAPLTERLSRWTLIMFACALANFLLGQALIVLGFTWPSAALTGGATLAAVHLVTIGWLTLLMLGALSQFVPVITSRALLDQRLSAAALVLIEVGLVGMVTGFVTRDMARAPCAWCLVVGGLSVFAGVVLALVNLATPLLRTRPLPLPGRFVRAGFIFLIITMSLGLLFAFTFRASASSHGPLLHLASGVGYHAIAGVGGWLTLTAMGVSYKLLSMFMLAPEERGVLGEVVLWLGITGFGLTVAAGLLDLVWQGSVMILAERAGWLLIGASISAYLADLVRLYRARKRRRIELHNRAAAGAFISLAAALVTAAILVISGRAARVAPPLVVLALLGWLGGLGLTQLYKVIPFLSWLTRFGKLIGRGWVPRVQDLVCEPCAALWFFLYFAGVWLTVVGAAIETPLPMRGGAALSTLATLGLSREYWRAWRGTYVRFPPAVSSHAPTIQREDLRHGHL
ncbi:MAG: hypothetical protein ACYCVY_02345 [Acidiferrobacteraceae bacterium]